MDKKPISKMTKAELVEAINALPGENVTMRPRKSTLEEVYRERIKERNKAHVPPRRAKSWWGWIFS